MIVIAIIITNENNQWLMDNYKPNGFADHYPYEKWLFHWED